MRSRPLIGLLAALGLIVSQITPTQAGGRFHHGYGHGQYGHGYFKSHRHGGYRHGYGSSLSFHASGDAALIAGAVIGGLLLGQLLSSPRHNYSKPRYAPAPRARVVYRPRDCRGITGVGEHHGRPADFGGTYCYDQYGRGYVVPGSAYFIRYRH